MIVQNHKIQFIFVDWFITFCICFLTSLAFFLGFDITFVSVLTYLIVNVIVIMISCICYILFHFLYNSYTEILEDKILIYKNNEITKIIERNKIKRYEYSSVWNQLFLDTKGGYLRVYYEVNGREDSIFISLSKKQYKRISLILK